MKYQYDFIKEVITDHLSSLEKLNDKLTLLTDIFILTEDLRDELLFCGVEIQKGRTEPIRDQIKGRFIEVDSGLQEST